MNPVLERAARAAASVSLAKFFGYPSEAEIVQTAVNAQWQEYADGVRAALGAIAGPNDDILAAIKPAKERDEFAKQWTTAMAAILG